MPMSASANPVQRSFELVAARCEKSDAAGSIGVCSKSIPKRGATFRSKGSELVMGSMLTLMIEADADAAIQRLIAD